MFLLIVLASLGAGGFWWYRQMSPTRNEERTCFALRDVYSTFGALGSNRDDDQVERFRRQITNDLTALTEAANRTERRGLAYRATAARSSWTAAQEEAGDEERQGQFEEVEYQLGRMATSCKRWGRPVFR